ncbi:MAG TPA: sigma-70 family RNA polymerase sigma factor [Anaerolineae bacterium]|nr:sigma-70 family RNA polymerase sigma factor [Anaerolineae bacterium]
MDRETSGHTDPRGDATAAQEASHPLQAAAEEWSGHLAAEAVYSREALEHLYALHAPQLYRYFWMHTRSQQLAEDLVSETFLGALRSLSSYRADQGLFIAWLYGIARHVLARHAYDLARRAARIAGEARADGLADDSTAAAEERIDLWQAMGELSGFEREVIALKFGVGLTHVEIGEMKGLRTGSVRAVLRRALQRLRARLASGGGDAQ